MKLPPLSPLFFPLPHQSPPTLSLLICSPCNSTSKAHKKKKKTTEPLAKNMYRQTGPFFFFLYFPRFPPRPRKTHAASRVLIRGEASVSRAGKEGQSIDPQAPSQNPVGAHRQAPRRRTFVFTLCRLYFFSYPCRNPKSKCDRTTDCPADLHEVFWQIHNAVFFFT